MGRGLRLEDVSRGKKMFFEQTCVVYFLNYKAFGGSRVKTRKMYLARRCILSNFVLFT